MSSIDFVDNSSLPTLISTLANEFDVSHVKYASGDTPAIYQIMKGWNGDETNLVDYDMSGQLSIADYIPYSFRMFGNTSSYDSLSIQRAPALCGVPVFCSNEASFLCSNVTLNQCEECSMIGAGIFAAVCVVLGLLIVLGNVMVITMIMKKDLKDGFSKLKASLAFADAFTGNDVTSKSSFYDYDLRTGKDMRSCRTHSAEQINLSFK